jgi:ubiquitin thioesterase OTU1
MVAVWSISDLPNLHPTYMHMLMLHTLPAGNDPAPTSVRLADGSCVVRRIIPSDNSCLFTAVGYVMEHDRGRAAALRQVIAEVVAADPGASNV